METVREANVKVVLCSMVSHYSHTALALQRAGYLKQYITNLVFSKSKREIATKVLPIHIRKKLLGGGRYNGELKPSLVTSL